MFRIGMIERFWICIILDISHKILLTITDKEIGGEFGCFPGFYEYHSVVDGSYKGICANINHGDRLIKYQRSSTSGAD